MWPFPLWMPRAGVVGGQWNVRIPTCESLNASQSSVSCGHCSPFLPFALPVAFQPTQAQYSTTNSGAAYGWCSFSVWLYLLWWSVLQIIAQSVQSLSCVRLFVTPWTAARQASLSITNSWSSIKPMSIESVMPSNRLILCHPLFLPSIFPSIRVFSNESALRIRWPKYWTFSFNISLTNEHPGPISFRMDWLDLLAVQGTLYLHAKSFQSCPTLCDPVGCSPPGSSGHGILQARILAWVAVPFSRGSPSLGVEPMSRMRPALAGGFFTTSTTCEAWAAPNSNYAPQFSKTTVF